MINQKIFSKEKLILFNGGPSKNGLAKFESSSKLSYSSLKYLGVLKNLGVDFGGLIYIKPVEDKKFLVGLCNSSNFIIKIGNLFFFNKDSYISCDTNFLVRFYKISVVLRTRNFLKFKSLIKSVDDLNFKEITI